VEASFSRGDAHQVVGRRSSATDTFAHVSSLRPDLVLALLSRGWDNARIGRDLFISQHTVRTHIQNILKKLGMHSKLEAATFAMRRSTELEPIPGAGLGS
jgi:DNA-binding NarL/FixJ family response regulator